MSKLKTEENVIYYNVTLTSEKKTHTLLFAIDFTNCDETQAREIAAREIRTRALDKARVNSQDKESRIIAKREVLKTYQSEMNTKKFITIEASEFATIRVHRAVKTLDEQVSELSLEQLKALNEKIQAALKAAK
jgi:hypothetical protein